MLKVNEIFASIQGEGAHAGQSMIFVRLTGCNLRCPFCDTKSAYDDGTDMSESDILDQCLEFNIGRVCLTGGEPLLQDLSLLVSELHYAEFMIFLETNGTQQIPNIFDYVVVSPKRGASIDQSAYHRTHEWKYIIEDPGDFDRIRHKSVSLQPVDNDMEIAKLCIEQILTHPGWRLSLQLHKLIGVR